MKIIGFYGGSSLCEVGTTSDMVLFFDCIEYFVVKKYLDQDWNLLTNRLYCKYLRQEELAETSRLMSEVKLVFAGLASAEVDWKDELIGDKSKTWLNPDQTTLADVFSRYFELFAHCVESAQLFFETWKIYQPVKIVPTDLPGFATEKARPLKEYDELEGKPFWLHYKPIQK